MDEAANQGEKAKPGAAAPPAQRVSLFGGRRKSGNGNGNGNGPGNGKAPPKRQRRPRGFGLSGLSGLLTFVLAIGLLGVGVLVWSVVESRKPGPLAADKIVVIEREDDSGTIGEQLERAGVVDSALWFSAMTMLDGSRSSLKRGEYAFKAGVSLRQVEAELIAHKVVQHKLTIPEGLTSDQVVERLRDDDVLVGDVKEPPREGSLLPDTYLFERGDTRQAELTRMAKAQAKLVDEIWAKRAPDLPIKSPGELITLASIVEKETGKADERPRVAGVFVNRLQKHMRLQSDPTIVYGLAFGKGTLGHPITKAELDQPTPYNTYNIDGLPPGPICNPGRAALEAVANPMRTKELYFVADGTGGHAFAETLDQHLKNVAHWRQVEQDAKDRLAPDAAPTPAPTPTPAKHSALDGVDPAVFGAVALGDAPVDSGPLATRLGKLAQSRKATAALLSPDGALSAPRAAGASLDKIGAVVTGVNDEPPTQAFPDDPGPDSPAQPVASVPLSAAALADQKARIARYVGAGPIDPRFVGPPDPRVVGPADPRFVGPADPRAAGPANPRVAGLDAPAGAPARARAFDASEGTPFDPLRNKTYDLNYAHAVPALESY
jgi:UPF0755 protein